jgi:hypothetical protein
MNPDELDPEHRRRANRSLLLPFSKEIVLEEGYVLPETHSQNDPSCTPLHSRLPKKAFAHRA